MTAEGPPDAGPPPERTWSCPLVLAGYAALEHEIADYLSGIGVEGRAAFVAQLVAEETVRNLVEHSPGAGPHATATVRIVVDVGVVVVHVEDRQQGFDPLAGPPLDTAAPLSGRRPGGMGLHLLRDLTDELTYEQTPAGNRLTARVARG